MANSSVAIVGAGLAGLCVAQTLNQAGFHVQVYERDYSLHARRQGYRITVDKHGAAALKQCLPARLFEAVVATASSRSETCYFRFTNQDLGEIFTRKFKPHRPSGGISAIGQVDRATLRTIMLSGLEGKVHFGKEATRVESASDGATLYFADTSSVRASLVLGADGVSSVLRRQILPGCPTIDTGSRAIYGKTPLIKDGRTLVPRSLENSGVTALGAPGRSFFFTSMRFKEDPQKVFARLVFDQEPPVTADYVMWAIVLPTAELPESAWELSARELHGLAIEAALDYHPLLRRLVDEADSDYTLATSLSAATRPKEWVATRTTLMGDAVHVMPPAGAHGGNTALRDAALLAQKLQDAARFGTPVAGAIQEYQDEMLIYAFKEVDRARAMLRRANVENPQVRWLMMRALPWLRSLTRAPLAIDGV